METSERRQRAGEEAAEWWVRLQSENMSREEREAFVDWLRESAIHVAEMLRMASVHGALEQFERWMRIATQGSSGDSDVVVPLPGRAELPATEMQGAEPDRPHTLRWSIAAAVACVAVALALMLPALRGQVMQTERGERREVVLADGSVVQIDPETRLRVRFEDKVRRVSLDRGRALFRVAKNSQRPFLVEADATTVRAVGTAFGVERKDRDVVVTVAEGKVAIEGRARRVYSAQDSQAGSVSPKATQASDQSEERIFLAANEQVTVPSAEAVAEIRRVDSSRALAWAEGRLIFEHTPVGEVVAQFNRYNSIQLRIEDEQLSRRPISGVFNAANPEAFIDFIQATTAVRVSRERDGDIVIAGDH